LPAGRERGDALPRVLSGKPGEIFENKCHFLPLGGYLLVGVGGNKTVERMAHSGVHPHENLHPTGESWARDSDKMK